MSLHIAIESIVSDATNAYDLLGDIAKLAIDEPKRIDMSIVRIRSNDDRQFANYDRVRPACGTVGCVAGWTITLAKLKDRTSLDSLSFSGPSSMDEAGSLLGLTAEQQTELFMPDHLISDIRPRLEHVYRQSDGTRARIRRSQTREHARQTARHIRAFMAKYADQLKARPVQTRTVSKP